MWSLGVIVYVLLTLARAQEWNLWRTIRAGQSNCIDSESFGKHLRTGFSEVSTVECSVLIPAPPKWCESYSSLEASFRDENMIVVFLQTRNLPKLASPPVVAVMDIQGQARCPLQAGFHRVTNNFQWCNPLSGIFPDLSVLRGFTSNRQVRCGRGDRCHEGKLQLEGLPSLSRLQGLGWGKHPGGPRFGVFLPSW